MNPRPNTKMILRVVLMDMLFWHLLVTSPKLFFCKVQSQSSLPCTSLLGLQGISICQYQSRILGRHLAWLPRSSDCSHGRHFVVVLTILPSSLLHCLRCNDTDMTISISSFLIRLSAGCSVHRRRSSICPFLCAGPNTIWDRPMGCCWHNSSRDPWLSWWAWSPEPDLTNQPQHIWWNLLPPPLAQ